MAEVHDLGRVVGKSAYEQAVDGGFTGTLEEFQGMLANLQNAALGGITVLEKLPDETEIDSIKRGSVIALCDTSSDTTVVGSKNALRPILGFYGIVKSPPVFKFKVTGTGGVSKPYLNTFAEPDMDIDWGDGTAGVWGSDDWSGNNHTYAEDGEYIVTIKELRKGQIMPEEPWKEILTPFPKFYPALGDTYSYLNSAPNLEKICGKLFINNPEVTGLQSFAQGSKIKELPQDLFEGCVNLIALDMAFLDSDIEEVPDGFFSYCPKIKSFFQCFRNTKRLKKVGAAFKNCTDAENFQSCFQGSGVEDVSPELFNGCTNAKDFSTCFYEAGLQEIPEGLFLDCVNAITFALCFYRTPISQIPIELFDPCTKVENFGNTFSGCTGATGEAPQLWLRTDPVPIGTACFRDCTDLSNYDSIPGNWK